MKNKPMTEITETANKGFEETVASMKVGAAQFGAQATAGVEQSQVKMKEGMDKAMKTAEEMMAFGQGNIETMGLFKAMTSVKSLKDAMELQSSLTKSSFEKAIAEGGRLTEASVKLTEQALAPITARVTLAVEKFAKTA